MRTDKLTTKFQEALGDAQRLALANDNAYIDARHLLRYCARPPFALDRLHEVDSERLRYDNTKPGPGGNGPLVLTSLELIDRIAALVPPPRIHRHRYSGASLRTTAYQKFPGRPRLYQSVLHKIITRTMKLLTRRGVLVEEEGSTYMADNDGDSDEARTLRPLHAAACTYRIAFGPRAGQKVLTVQGAMPRDADFKQHLCADIDGFSLHAAVRCAADDRQALEQLCRYITRPALANERVQTNAAGQVVLKLKTPWRDGTTHLIMSPLEFMQRLAALVPRPRLHLIRFHGVLAPNAKLRALVVPQEPEAPEAKPADCEANCAHHRPVRLSWAKLLKRVFDFDLEHCPNCGGELKIIAAILEAPVIEKILTHLGLQARAPPRAPARGQALQAA